MEKAKYLMIAKRRPRDEMSTTVFLDPSRHDHHHLVLPSFSFVESPSWDEEAFARDSAHLGGCIWPPRSYSCSFCGREFRSAQALGGHMNVHRKDRAILKQYNSSSSPTGSETLETSSEPCSTINQANPNPNPNPNPNSNFKVCSSISLNGYQKEALFFEERPTLQLFASPESSNLINEIDLSKQVILGTPEEEEEELFKISMNKRRRTDHPGSPFLINTMGVNLEVEELDLELRLGDAPQVK